jgi:hypothetical protein
MVVFFMVVRPSWWLSNGRSSRGMACVTLGRPPKALKMALKPNRCEVVEKSHSGIEATYTFCREM